MTGNAMKQRRGRTLRRAFGAVGSLAAAVLLCNCSWFVSPHGDGRTRWIAHRGVHQTYGRDGLTNETCTAQRIDPPVHDLLENTLPSMEAAFAAGADVVELDVHLTTDKQFAVLHDWTVDCRTQGSGVTEQLDMAYLKTLDVGWGYTADGGRTHPLRGKGVGMMPTLPEVFARFPKGRFLVNFKSRRVEEGEALARLVEQHPAWRGALWATYGGDEPTRKSTERISGLRGFTRGSIKSCAIDYLLTGWTGVVPRSCRNTFVLIPSNLTWAVWGWPHKFTRRMERAGSTVILIGPAARGDVGARGIDSLEELPRVPAGFAGYVWTNHIEVLGAAIEGRDR